MRTIDPALKQVAGFLRERYGARLKQALFFGSRARGDAASESDYDCLLIFERVSAGLKTDVDRFAAALLLDQGLQLSCVVLSEDQLERFRFEPFLQNARREGIAA